MALSIFNDTPSVFNKNLAEQLGHAAYLLTHVHGHQGRETTRSFNLLIAAIYHEQIRFFFDQNGTPIAFIAWAYPSPPVQRKLAQQIDYSLHESEWNENGPPWVVDMVVQRGYLRPLLRELRTSTFKEDKLVRFIHQKTSQRRVVTWGL